MNISRYKLILWVNGSSTFYRGYSKALVFFLAMVTLNHQALADDQWINRDIQKQLALPENKIDVGIAALTFAKEIYPDINIAAYSMRIDRLAEKVSQLANGTLDPERRVRVLNTVLFRNEGFHYDLAPFARDKQDYYFLNGILDTKNGICYTLPLLYIAVAQRLGYPVYPVEAPDHIFVRYVDPSFKMQNIETTSGGKYFEDEWYIQDFAIGKKGLASGSYLRTLTYREFLAAMLMANAYVFAQTDGNKAMAYTERAIQLDPKYADNYYELQRGYRAKSKIGNAAWAEKYQKLADKYAAKAKELGYVSPIEINNARGIRGK